MSEQASNNSTLYFLVGGLLVAVIAIGYIAMGRGGGDADVSAAPAATSSTAEESGSQFKVDVSKDGSVSGSIDHKSDD